MGRAAFFSLYYLSSPSLLTVKAEEPHTHGVAACGQHRGLLGRGSWPQAGPGQAAPSGPGVLRGNSEDQAFELPGEDGALASQQ